MSVEDLESRRHASRMTALAAVRTAQIRLESETQLKGALVLLAQIGEPRSEGERWQLADALECAVDGLCNRGATEEARRIAIEKVDLVHAADPGPSGAPRKPQSLAGFRAARIEASAIELDRDPDDAMRRLIGLFNRLSKESYLGDTRLEEIHILRGVLSAAKREGTATARRFADLARVRGDPLANDVAQCWPDAAASYFHRAAVERRAREQPSAQREAAELFETSLPLRPDTPRDRKSRGMAVGDLMVLRGDRQAGARILTNTVFAFKNVLPRHHESALRQLVMRDLLLAS